MKKSLIWYNPNPNQFFFWLGSSRDVKRLLPFLSWVPNYVKKRCNKTFTYTAIILLSKHFEHITIHLNVTLPVASKRTYRYIHINIHSQMFAPVGQMLWCCVTLQQNRWQKPCLFYLTDFPKTIISDHELTQFRRQLDLSSSYWPLGRFSRQYIIVGRMGFNANFHMKLKEMLSKITTNFPNDWD